jgi:probable rRNA maturation factor
MAITLAVQRVYRGAAPGRPELLRWVRTALAPYRETAAVTLRIVDRTESAALNATWRHKQGPTNVLSFPIEGLDAIAPELLGDIVVCAPVVADEAAAQCKPIEAHWAHMVVHGCLHLLGFDHVAAADTVRMEAAERSTLASLGFPDPYRELT